MDKPENNFSDRVTDHSAFKMATIPGLEPSGSNEIGPLDLLDADTNSEAENSSSDNATPDSPMSRASPFASPPPIPIPESQSNSHVQSHSVSFSNPRIVTPLQVLSTSGPAASLSASPTSALARPISAPNHMRKLRGPGKLDSAQQSLFSERWMDRRGSSSSQAQQRFFRQNSIVSIDLATQDPRRTSIVGEVEEVPPDDGYMLSRTDSRVSVVSISEYQRLPDWQGPSQVQAQLPLLGDSEVDMGLEWEHDFEDYGFNEGRRSVASSFYAMISP